MFLVFRNIRPQRALACALIVFGIVMGEWLLSTLAPLEAVPASNAGPGSVTAQARGVVPPLSPDSDISDQMARKQRKDLLKSNFEKMKRDADELLELAQSLQDELAKSNENVFSLRIMDRAEKIERLAKSIRNTAKGN
jgi:hypothetical protein